MRIYTNFDSWKMMAHHISLGWTSYKGKDYNLDDKKNQLEFLNQLIEDKVIGLWNYIEEEIDSEALEKKHFRFLSQEFENFNYKMDGSSNKMQYYTILTNLKVNQMLEIQEIQ